MTMTIGQVATRAGVHVETVRYYERRKLLPSPPRTSAGHRQYPPEVIVRIRFIKRAQELGFSLKEIGELLALRVRHGAACHDVEQKARAKVGLVENKILQLEKMKHALESLTQACRTRSPTGECPILEVLEAETDAL